MFYSECRERRVTSNFNEIVKNIGSMQDGFFFFLIFKQKIRYRTVIKIAKRVERDKLYQQKVNGHAEIFSK